MIRLFRHYIPVLAILLGLGEGLAFYVLNLGIEYIALNSSFGAADASISHLMAVWISFVIVTVMSSIGMYNRDVMFRLDAVVIRSIVTFPLAFIVLYMTLVTFSAVVGEDFAQIKVVAISIPLCGLVAVLMHRSFVRFMRFLKFQRRYLVLGCGEMAVKVRKISRMHGKQFTVVGYVDLNHEEVSPELGPVFPRERIMTPKEAMRLVEQNDVDEILIATRERRGLPLDSLLECRMHGCGVQEYSTFCEAEAGLIDLDELKPSWLIFSDGFRNNRGRHLIKRLFDIVVSFLLLVITLPVTLPTALLVRWTSVGPIFYRQERVGLEGKTFDVLKFRSMRTDAEKSGPKWATASDDRVTPIGRFIRKVRIDEIPQVINVLLGDMSFIGPRPERPIFVKQLAEQIPYFEERHRVKPGITGWAQINYPYGASVEDAKHKLSYDLYYLKNNGLFLDVVILLQTVRVILWPSGAR